MLFVVFVLVLVQAVFSLWPVLIHLLLEGGVSGILLAVVRDIIASILLWMGVWCEAGMPDLFDIFQSLSATPKKIFTVDSSEMNLFILLGLSSSANSLGYVLALRYVSPFNSALLHPTIPVFAAILGSIYGVEKLSPRKILGACICIAGSVVVVMSQSELQISSSLYGNLLLLLQSFAMAVLLVGQKFVSPRHTPLKTTAIFYTVGTVLSCPLCMGLLIYNNELQYFNYYSSLVIAYGAVFVVAFNYAALTWANKASSPAVPASSMMLQPPLTYILGYFLDGKQLTGWWEVGGGGVIILGLVLTTFPMSGGPENQIGYTTMINSVDEDDDRQEQSRLLSFQDDSPVGSHMFPSLPLMLSSSSAGGALSSSSFQSSQSLTKRSSSSTSGNNLNHPLNQFSAYQSYQSPFTTPGSSRSSSPIGDDPVTARIINKL